MADVIQIRRDTAANWTSVNPTLASGELGHETDTDKIKVGDASTAWTSLGYVIDTGGYAALSGATFTGAVAGTNFTGTGAVEAPTVNASTTLQIGGTAVTSDANELNLLDNVSGLVKADLTKLAAVDASATELNLLDGVSGLVQADLTKLAAVDTTAAELNVLEALDRGSIIYGNAAGATTVLGQGTAGQILTSDGTDISWAANSGSGVSTLSDLTDVSTSGAVNGKIIKYNGSSWVIADDIDTNTDTLGGLTDVSTSGAANGKILKHNGTSWVVADDIDTDTGILSVIEDTTPQLGGDLDVNGKDLVSISNGPIDLNPHGSGTVVFSGNATRGAGQFKLNCEQNTHGITIKGPPHSAAAGYTLTLPNDDGSADQALKTDGSGALSWIEVITPDGNGDVTLAEELKAKSYNETYATVSSSSNATTIDCETGNTFTHTLTEDTTFTFSNPPATGTAYSFTLKVIQDSTARAITWPGTVDWAAATAPTLTATNAGIDVFVFLTHDGGTTWYGFICGQALG